MSTSSGASSSDSRAAISVEQILGECFLRVAQTVLTARIYEDENAPATDRTAKRSNWFKMDLQEVQSARPALERWRSERGIGLPLVLEVFVQPAGAHAASVGGQLPATLVERWEVHLRPTPMVPFSAAGLTRTEMARVSPQGVYKRLTIMLRSLYSYVRLLPAYRLYRACRRQRGAAFALTYKLHSTLPFRATTTTTAQASGQRPMQQFAFAPVPTAEGQLAVSVDYQPASAVRVLEQSATPLPRTHIIVDYVGGRGAARNARLLPGEGQASGHPSPPPSPLAPAPSAPASLEFTQRRRSWSSAFRVASPRLSPAAPSNAASPRPPTPTAAAASPQSWTPPSAIATGRGSLLEAATERPTAAASLPRTLSSPARSALPAPAGRPPLPRPGASPSPGPSPSPLALRMHSGGALQEVDSSDEGGSPLSQGSEGGRAGRRATAPMRIPGRVLGSRLRSSGDLGALQAGDHHHQQQQQAAKPLSAPATSHMRPVSATSVVPSAGDLPSATVPSLASAPPLPSPSPTPPPTLPESSSSSRLSSQPPFPASCSPDLPFAFTPTARSRISPRRASSVRPPGAAAVAAAAPAGGSLGGAAKPASTATSSPREGSAPPSESPPRPLTAREVPSSLALVRRASWGSRSLSGGGMHSAEGSLPIGYSVSPLHDPFMESLLSGSTPRQFRLAGSSALQPPQLHPLQAGTQPRLPLLTFGPTGGGRGELDHLPFAFPGSVGGSPPAPAPCCSDDDELGGGLAGASPFLVEVIVREGSSSVEDAAWLVAAADASSTAAAVGAFVKLVQSAQPLARGGPTALDDGLSSLHSLRKRLQAKAGSAAGAAAAPTSVAATG